MVVARASRLSRDEQLEHDVTAFITANYPDHDLCINDFCDFYPHYGRRTVQRALAARGSSWRKILCLIRMAAAHKLMITTALPVMAVADAVGYRHQAQFTIQYRRVYDQSPLDTRREARLGAR